MINDEWMKFILFSTITIINEKCLDDKKATHGELIHDFITLRTYWMLYKNAVNTLLLNWLCIYVWLNVTFFQFLTFKDYFFLIDFFIMMNDNVLAKKLISDMKIDVDRESREIWNRSADGPLLLSAIKHLNLKMVKSLVVDFQADVNKEIKLKGNQSTLLIFAIGNIAG